MKSLCLRPTDHFSSVRAPEEARGEIPSCEAKQRTRNMKLTVAIVTALSAGELAHGFVVPSGQPLVSCSSTSTALERQPNKRGSNTCPVSMKASEQGVQAMDRTQMLKSAALAFGAVVVTGNPSESFAATAVDYNKVTRTACAV